jgi:hypothetical protein
MSSLGTGKIEPLFAAGFVVSLKQMLPLLG